MKDLTKKNLLDETLRVLNSHDKTPADVLWVGAESFGRFSWSDFEKRADIEYDFGYGAQEVAYDLIICGEGWWMTRREYDGSECWQWHEQPEPPQKERAPRLLSCSQTVQVGWKSLQELHEEKWVIVDTTRKDAFAMMGFYPTFKEAEKDRKGYLKSEDLVVMSMQDALDYERGDA